MSSLEVSALLTKLLILVGLATGIAIGMALRGTSVADRVAACVVAEYERGGERSSHARTAMYDYCRAKARLGDLK